MIHNPRIPIPAGMASATTTEVFDALALNIDDADIGEAAQRSFVVRVLAALGHSHAPEILTSMLDGSRVRLYVWHDSPAGDFVLVTGPQYKGKLVRPTDLVERDDGFYLRAVADQSKAAESVVKAAASGRAEAARAAHAMERAAARAAKEAAPKAHRAPRHHAAPKHHGPEKRPWYVEEDGTMMLGFHTDQVIADITGRSVAEVTEARVALGIPEYDDTPQEMSSTTQHATGGEAYLATPPGGGMTTFAPAVPVPPTRAPRAPRASRAPENMVYDEDRTGKASVSPEIADTFGMRDMPNVTVQEQSDEQAAAALAAKLEAMFA